MQDFESSRDAIKWLLATAWLLPLAGFAIEVFGGWWSTRRSRTAAYLAVGCIAGGFVCSVAAYSIWSRTTDWSTRYHQMHVNVEATEDFVHADADQDRQLNEEEFHHTALANGQLSHLWAEHAAKHDEEEPAEKSEDESGTAESRESEAVDEHAGQGVEFATVDADGDGAVSLHEFEHHVLMQVDPETAGAAAAHGDGEQTHEEHADIPVVSHAFSGAFYDLGTFGSLRIGLDYYVDSLTLLMFMMVTLIATCIHVFAIGYMSDELTEDYVDHHAHTADGKHVHRPGRFYLFFSYLSLFSFSMLGLVLAGNVFQVFVFWELVGICSYLLIGFYVERKSASTAANKAFIMNRVGDFGFLIGLMVIWTYFGTFQFVEMDNSGHVTGGIFEMLRGESGRIETEVGEDGLATVSLLRADGTTSQLPYTLLVVAGLGVFAGCIGKSAQFPLQTWLPDAMEGPTPVSALVHSATMVAAGVYLVGRFYPMFAPEVLLTIAYVGCITLFLGATIAIVATDIKRVLAYSTISQLGYMMLGLGVFGWAAGLFHLITHAFFKSLLFLCSGSVIVGCHHEQEMPRMGGLWRKMPITAFTMLVGVIAISGWAIPFTTLAFSGFYSKDAIVATALTHSNLNSVHFLLFFVPLVTAGITAFYMFRLWFYTFLGKPRDEELHSHVHESPAVMTVPLIVLALFAAFCAAGGEGGPLFLTLRDSEPVNVATTHAAEVTSSGLIHHGHADVLYNHANAGNSALLATIAGTLLAYLLYVVRLVNPADIKRQAAGVYDFLVDKWRFDQMYDTMFVYPAHVIARFAAWIDRNVFDAILHAVCRAGVWVSKWDRVFDERLIDGLVNLVGQITFNVGTGLKTVQTGKLRQYVMFIAVGLMAVFVILFVFLPR